MSRTYRRKNETHEYDWLLRADRYYIFNDTGGRYHNYWVSSPPAKNKDRSECVKEINRFHSDAYTHECKEPGPAWYRLLNTERPQRRHAKNELRKYMLNEEMEVILNPMDKLEYWT